jgi:hypothetical protein
MNFEAFEVGKPYLGKLPTTQGMAVVSDDTSLTLVISLAGLSDAETTAIRSGHLALSVYVDRSIPFICARFEAINLEMDCHINNWLIPPVARNKLLGGESQANLVYMFLVDTSDRTLKAIRVVGLPVAMIFAIKSALFVQLKDYSDATAVDRAAADIREAMEIKTMMAEGLTHIFDPKN